MTNRMGLGLDIESDKQINSLVSLKVLVKVGDSPVVCEQTGGVVRPLASSLEFGGQ